MKGLVFLLEYINSIPKVNLQAFIAIFLFLLSLFIARIVVNIQTGKWPGNQLFVTYLRVVLGFTFAASIALGFYSFAGIDIVFK